MLDKYVLVTGATSEIGRSFLQLVLECTQLPIIIAGSYPIGLSALDTRCYKHIPMNANLQESVVNASAILEHLDIGYFAQFHGASIPSDTLLDQTFDSLLYHYNVNTFSTVILLAKILPSMIDNGFGRITLMNTASSSHGGGSTSFGYGISKHSVDFVVKHLAKYYTSHNILSNCVSPGFVDTRFHSYYMNRSPENLKSREKLVPIGRACTSAEVSHLFYNLLFENTYISGQNIKIDGADFV